MQTPSVVLLLVDEDPLVEYLVKEISYNGFESKVVHSFEELLQQIEREQFACVIVGLGTGSLQGLRVLEELLQRHVALASIAVVEDSDIRMIVQAARQGTVTFLLRESTGPQEIQFALRVATAQTTQLRIQDAKRKTLRARFAKLNTGESQVLELLMKGQKLTTIADALDLSRRTIELRRARLMSKLGVVTFPELIALAIEYEGDPQISQRAS